MTDKAENVMTLVYKRFSCECDRPVLLYVI